jgi:hypothetical protein
MSNLTNFKLSKYRSKILGLLEELKKPATRCLYLDSLIKGIPGEVFRKCGKQNCQCANDLTRRHGPYKVVSIYKNGKQRQISLKKSENEKWQLATRYQYQIEQLKEVKRICIELENTILEVINERIKDFPDG